MKKTLIITLEYPPQIGGIATYVDGMTQEFPPEDVVIYAPNFTNETWVDDGNYTVVRDTQLFAFGPFRWLKMFFTSIRLIKKYGIERILVHHVLPAGIVAWLITYLYHIQYAVFFHGTDVRMSAAKKRKKRMTQRILERSSKVYTNSVFLQKKLLQTYSIDQEKLSVIYPSFRSSEFDTMIDPQMLDALRSQFSLHGKKVLLTVARMVDGKGYPLLVRAIPELLKDNPNIVWIIAGSGPKQEWLEEEIRTQQLYNVVRMVGDIPHTKLPEFFALADVFVLLTHKDKETESEESFGYVFLESYAAGVPVVAGSSGGVEEVVIHGETGLVVDAYDTTAVSSAVEYMLEHTAESESFIENGKKLLAKKFTWKSQMKDLAAFLEL